jgi:hypothetical protein
MSGWRWRTLRNWQTGAGGWKKNLQRSPRLRRRADAER